MTGHLNDCIAHNGNLDQEIGQLKAQLIDSNNTINTQKELIESLNEEIAVLQDSITHNEFKAQNLTEQHADNISQHTAKIDELNKRVISKQQEINSLLRTRSWIITKPLRFTFRLLRGQHRIALQPLKGQVREQLKHIYYKAPASYRRILLNAAFKVRPGWFQHHPQFLKANSGAFQSNVKKTEC